MSDACNFVYWFSHTRHIYTQIHKLNAEFYSWLADNPKRQIEIMKRNVFECFMKSTIQWLPSSSSSCTLFSIMFTNYKWQWFRWHNTHTTLKTVRVWQWDFIKFVNLNTDSISSAIWIGCLCTVHLALCRRIRLYAFLWSWIAGSAQPRAWIP